MQSINNGINLLQFFHIQKSIYTYILHYFIFPSIFHPLWLQIFMQKKNLFECVCVSELLQDNVEYNIPDERFMECVKKI